ncbi:MAG: LuxR family transcriptional regulator [Deltaproteobacteria bacterium]|nr:MAG: LuxR family transcriptional regulator [Deltaproteobacteria bacterium]
MRQYVSWPVEVLDAFDHAVAVVDARDTIVYANPAARRLLAGAAPGIPVAQSPPAAAIVARARSAAAVRETDIEVTTAEGVAWRGCAWPVNGGAVAFAVRAQRAVDRREALQHALGLHRRDAQLALDVTDGRANKDIAADLGVPLGTVATRLSRLYRRVGVTNRAELAALVTRTLDRARA